MDENQIPAGDNTVDIGADPASGPSPEAPPPAPETKKGGINKKYLPYIIGGGAALVIILYMVMKGQSSSSSTASPPSSSTSGGGGGSTAVPVPSGSSGGGSTVDLTGVTNSLAQIQQQVAQSNQANQQAIAAANAANQKELSGLTSQFASQNAAYQRQIAAENAQLAAMNGRITTLQQQTPPPSTGPSLSVVSGTAPVSYNQKVLQTNTNAQQQTVRTAILNAKNPTAEATSIARAAGATGTLNFKGLSNKQIANQVSTATEATPGLMNGENFYQWNAQTHGGTT